MVAEALESADHARALRPRVRCTYCHDAVERGTSVVVHCASCLAPHHGECHAEHGRCAAPGCDDPRGLVPDPSGRPARASLPPGATKGKAAARRWPRALVVGALLGASALLAWAAWPDERTIEPAPTAPAPMIDAPAPAGIEAPPPPARVVVLERLTREVALVARDFRLPVVLARGERLLVEAGEQGYTHVVLEPDPRTGRAPEARFVAEPGDVVEVVTGPRGARERLRAGPGEAIVLERAGDGPEEDQVRVSIVRP